MAKIEYLPEERMLLVLNDMVVDETRIHRYAFLLARQHSDELGRIARKNVFLPWYDDWEPACNGPSSKALSHDITKSIAYRFVGKVESDYPGLCSYGLTIKGRAKWRKLANEFSKEVKRIGDRVRKLQSMASDMLCAGMMESYPRYYRPAGVKWGS